MATEDGVFWTAGSADQTVRGQLTYGPDQSPELALYGPLTPALQVVSTTTDDQGNVVSELEPSDDAENFTIHGFLRQSPRRVSLVGCTTKGRRSVEGLGVQFEDQVVSARYMVRQAHVEGPDDKYSGVRIRLAHLDEWLHLPGFAINKDTDESIQLIYTRPELPFATLSSGERVEVSHDLRRSWPKPTGGHISRDSWIMVTGFDSATVRTIERKYIVPIVTFVNLAMGVGAPLLEVELQKDDRWCPMLHSGLTSPEGLPEERVHEFLLPLAGISLDNMAIFIDLASRLGPLGPIIADARSYLRRANLESQVLELTTVAEGMHRILYPDDYRFTKAESDKLRDLVRNALTGEPTKFWDVLRGFLSYVHEPNYKNRLRRLAAEAEQLLPGVTGDTSKWVRITDRARNNYAHRTTRIETDEEVDELYVVTRSLRWTLVAILLLHSGVEVANVSAQLTAHSKYRQFLRNMRASAPDTYPPTK